MSDFTELITMQLISKVEELLDTVIWDEPEKLAFYACLSTPVNYYHSFYTYDGAVWPLEYFVNDPRNADLAQTEFLAYMFAALAWYTNEFMKLREDDDQLPSEIYAVIDKAKEQVQFKVSHRTVFNRKAAMATARAWFISSGGMPLEKWRVSPIEKFKNWMNRDDAFAYVPTIEEILANPPWKSENLE